MVKTPKKANKDTCECGLSLSNVHDDCEFALARKGIAKGIELYKTLKTKGFPQGGQGNWYQDEKTGEKFYIPTPDEIYGQLIADPSGWQIMTDYMARAWIELKK